MVRYPSLCITVNTEGISLGEEAGSFTFKCPRLYKPLKKALHLIYLLIQCDMRMFSPMQSVTPIQYQLHLIWSHTFSVLHVRAYNDLVGQSFCPVLVVYPSLAHQAGGVNHREHGWQAGGYINYFFVFHWGRESPINKG